MNQSIGRLADTFHDQRKPNIHRWGRCSARGRSDFPRRTCTLKPPNVARPNHAIDKLPQSLFQSTIEKRTTFNGWINTKKAVRKKAATMVHAKETHDELYKASNHFLTDSDHRSQLENASLTFLRWFRKKEKKFTKNLFKFIPKTEKIACVIASQVWKNKKVELNIKTRRVWNWFTLIRGMCESFWWHERPDAWNQDTHVLRKSHRLEFRQRHEEKKKSKRLVRFFLLNLQRS
jgi:hypothetical protein